MEDKVKELLKEATNENENSEVMEKLILFIVAALVLIGVVFRKQIKAYFSDEIIEPTPDPEPIPEPVEMRFKAGDFVVKEGIEREIVEVKNGYYLWRYPDVPNDIFDSRDSSDPQFIYWELKQDEAIPDAELGSKANPIIVEPKPEAEKRQPTEGEPIIADIVHGSVVLRWLPREGAAEYHIRHRRKGGSSYVALASNVKGTEYIDIATAPGQSWQYVIVVVDANGQYLEPAQIGRIDVDVPDMPIPDNTYPLPVDENKELVIPANAKYFNMIVDPNKEGDLTQEIQELYNAVPDGTPEQYHVAQLPEGKYWTEGNMANNPRGIAGILQTAGRRFIIIQGIDGKQVTFYTKAPATPFESNAKKNDYSYRRHMLVSRSQNIIFNNIRIEGANTIFSADIGKTPETTPFFWKEGALSHQGYDNAGVHHSGWESEHAFQIGRSANILLNNCSAHAVFGDGVYWSHSKGIYIHGVDVTMAGRQSFALANGTDTYKMYKCTADNVRRSALDWEGDGRNGFILNGEISHCVLNGRISAGGAGTYENVEFHNNDYEGQVKVLGHPLAKRINWNFHHNRRTKAYQAGAPAITFQYTEGLKFEHNTELIRSDLSRVALRLSECSGEMSVSNNTWDNPAIIHLDNTNREEIKIENNTPELEVTDWSYEQ